MMSNIEVLPELKQIIGALLFGAKAPLKVSEVRRVLQQVAETWGGKTKDFARATEKDVRTAMDELKRSLEDAKIGIHVSEVANGYRLENDVSCGPWLRHLLSKGRPSRLSRPALETLAIIAYRQPCMRSEIEAVRGVQVDQIIRNLLEMQLVRIVGRSELPGRPWLFGTTQKFLEHFGLNNLEDLPGIEELRRLEQEQMKKQEASEGEAEEGESGGAQEARAPADADQYDEDDEDDED